jgi:hypothetical protein
VLIIRFQRLPRDFALGEKNPASPFAVWIQPSSAAFEQELRGTADPWRQKRAKILRNILEKDALQPQLDLGTAIRRHITHLGDVELVLPPRQPVRKPPKY